MLPSLSKFCYPRDCDVLGVQCLIQIIHNTPTPDLCQLNRVWEAQFIKAVLLHLLDLLLVLERAPQKLSHELQSVTLQSCNLY